MLYIMGLTKNSKNKTVKRSTQKNRKGGKKTINKGKKHVGKGKTRKFKSSRKRKRGGGLFGDDKYYVSDLNWKSEGFFNKLKTGIENEKNKPNIRNVEILKDLKEEAIYDKNSNRSITLYVKRTLTLGKLGKGYNQNAIELTPEEVKLLTKNFYNANQLVYDPISNGLIEGNKLKSNNEFEEAQHDMHQKLITA